MSLSVPYSLLFDGIYAGLISGISSITLKTCRTIASIYKHQNPDVAAQLKRLDVDRKLKIVESTIKLKKTEYQTMGVYEENHGDNIVKFDIVAGENTLISSPVELCLHYLLETILEIQTILDAINNKVKRHQQKWFSSWRTLDVKKYVNDLETNLRILDDRFNDLIRIHNVCNEKH